MPLFDVPGWSVPERPAAETHNAKKRKRTSSDGDTKLQIAQINFDRLMEKLEAGNVASHPIKKQKKKNCKSDKGMPASGSSEKPPSVEGSRPKGTKHKRGKKATGKQAEGSVSAAGHSEHEKFITDRKQPSQPQQNLTKLQAGLKNSLDGARFRWINEVLYKSESDHAHKMMRENPNVYEEYHTGFRHQVQSWPTNPVSHYTSALAVYPAKTVIADLGCGDAALARALVPKGFTVLSFDLVSDGAYVIEADTCGRLPLPGSEGPEKGTEGAVSEGQGGVVDVVVCALSLMGTNWPNCIREAWRVLRPNGELKIAEVASRFTDQDEFASFICSFGFRLKAKDDRNTHFTLFDFKRVARKSKGKKEWEGLLSRGSILKPCEYKRR
ncbi:hypothetical protein DAEQUDRAFT_685879 [Daedalea quercina L-15889]|uniref:Ribosomal RNA-processing protein 8 n=1 Tax=Daedalea quercina L-15889 TaxID=1314783 RepID=A0A165SZL0_9APHY|nr:hypothetical protein DAEQUDRAFT_685879 [Daedalea quercina L-15889]